MNFWMKEYQFLKSFKQKDLYSWDEIMGIIEDLENEIINLETKIENLELELSCTNDNTYIDDIIHDKRCGIL